MEKLFKIHRLGRRASIKNSCLLEQILPESETGKKRSIPQYQEWVIEKNRVLEGVSAVNEEFKLFMRPYRHPAAKKFYEEIKPLAVFLELQDFLKGDYLVQLSLKNENFDARILDGDKVVYYVEVTVINKNEQEVLGSYILNEQGYYVEGVEIVKKDKNRIAYDALSGLREFDDVVVNLASKIKEAIERKIAKEYHANTLLVIGGVCNVEYRDKDVLKFKNALDAIDSNVFERIFFVDLCKNFFVEKTNS